MAIVVALHSRAQLLHIVPQLAAMPSETEWFEFKVNNDDPETIGENVAALANSARLAGEAFAYIVWGVRDADHQIVGTMADPEHQKVKGQEVTNWLTVSLQPDVYFEFATLTLGSTRVVVLTIQAAAFQPIQFKGVEYIRVGSYTKPLSKHPDLARRLWRTFDKQPFETATALDRLAEDEVLSLLDYPSYFDLLKKPLPDNRAGIFQGLVEDEIIAKMPGTGWRITNLGAVLFAKRLEDFPSLKRKTLRVIQYKGNNKVETLKEQEGVKGYASGFEGLVSYINGVLPVNEVVGQALRTTTPMYPELAVRELVANALIHQDFTVSGAGPIIAIFEDRIEISNPGTPLVDVARLIDAPPRSRNERLAALMRRMGICEEQGSGWDKVAFQIEYYQLPAPLVDASAESMQVIMFSPRPLTSMGPDDRVRAVYLHTCLRYSTHENTTNSSIRARFNIPEKNKATASRLLRESVSAGAIVPYDPAAAAKLMRYVPYWAVPDKQAAFVDG